MRTQMIVSSLVVVLGLSCCGCGNQTLPAPSAMGDLNSVQSSDSSVTDSPEKSSPETKKMIVPTIVLNSPPNVEQSPAAVVMTATKDQGNQEQQEKIFEAMKPVQIMLGDWKGTTQREFGGFKSLDQTHWVWDLQSDPNQPAIVSSSEKSQYIRSSRLTWLIDQDVYRFELVDSAGKKRVLEGKFVQAAEKFTGDDQKNHVKYKLEFTQTDPIPDKDAWKLVFNQQENNRFLLEVYKLRGVRFNRFDTVASQREGTAFAKSDVGYGDKECVISGGLGVSQVSYKGTSYWVCCSGCKAAFDDNPEKWIAAFKSKQK